MFVINCLCYQRTKNFNCSSKVTVASQDVVKERSYRDVVQPRKVVPRNVVPRINSLEHNSKAIPRLTKTLSNYQGAFNDEFWPDMWYFVSMSIFFFNFIIYKKVVFICPLGRTIAIYITNK